ncbi:family 2, facilitated glucose transporter member [Seminavis robusta]|uniref:Hexose transporter 1 n=1 Tax=Seminavis robusta TaxID=568900 RepID=A0A9N8E597_9STRA|nr:family 2, facilitated glucose transporter member [Seminavis robusta]|eukprot:Sro632_g178670.1 family 2, facilitated glucose transporter member (543) ;mRNA; f:18089-19823
MSLSAAHSPKLGMSGSFGSSHCLTQAEEANLKLHRKTYSLPKDENSPLLPPSKKPPSPSSVKDIELGQDSPRQKKDARLSKSLLTTIVVVTIGSSLQFGYGTGVMNNSEDIIMEYFQDQGKGYAVIQWSTTVSCYGIGGLVGSLLGPKVIGAYCGRRATLLINNIFLVISSLLIALAPQWWYQAIGRIFVGIVAGIATAVVPTYFSEISPIAIRGAVGTMHQLGITVGILLSQALSTPSLNMLGSQDKWQWLFAVPVFCGLLEVIVLPFCPESPSYLYTTQGKEAARQALTQLQSEAVADEYLGYIEEEIMGANSDNNGGIMSIRELFRDRKLRKQLIVGITVQLMMQFSGIDAVFYYSTSVFKQAGVSDPALATTSLGIVNVIVTIFAVKFMDSAGRKTLLTYSWCGMCASFMTLTASFILKENYNVDYMDQLSVMAMTGVIIFFAFGPGCVAWFIIAEIIPLYARDSAMALGIFINWVANWLVAFSFPLLLHSTHPYTFLIFVASTGYFLYFTLRFVPETKGLTVSQLAVEFDAMPMWTC